MSPTDLETVAHAFARSKPKSPGNPSHDHSIRKRQWILDMWEVGMALFPSDVNLRVVWAEACGWDREEDGGPRLSIRPP